MGYLNKSISMQIGENLVNGKIPLCVICGEKPRPDGKKVCSTKCGKVYRESYAKAYYQTHKEEIKAYRRLHKEEIKAHMRAYHREHRKKRKR